MGSKVVKIVQNTLIGFIALVFIMGFFSKSIINLFLPKVVVESVSEGSVHRTLNIEGIVEAGSTTKIKLGGDVIVKEYFLLHGDTVTVGAPVFRIDKEFGVRGSDLDIKNLQHQLEKERYDLESKVNEDFTLEEENISMLCDKLEKSRKELLEKEALYNVGVVSLSEIEQIKNQIEEQEAMLKISELKLEQDKKNIAFAIKELQYNIMRLEDQIFEAKTKEKLYSKVDSNGVYISDIAGVLVNTGYTDRVSSQSEVLAEIAQFSEDENYVFKGTIFEADYNYVKSAGFIEFSTDNKNVCKAVITNISQIVNNGMLELTGRFEGYIGGNIKIGKRLVGHIKKDYKINDLLSVPKAAVITHEGFKEGSSGSVFILEEKEGILGKEYIAKKVDVKISAVGDTKVIVSGLEGFARPKVITNLSYKIDDGVKVFVWR